MVPSSLFAAACADRDVYAVLDQHREIMRRLEDVAERFWTEGRPGDAADVADMATIFAGRNHPGVLASPRLEAVLAAISKQCLPPLGPRSSGGDRERVLVVVTETYEVGAHTRMLWRWIARDPQRSYSVVTTGQHGVMPDGVREAVDASGGEIFDLPASAPALERASGLRRLAADADLIVLLDHPFDPIPMLAFAGLERRPPIVMMNQGDHQFWMGRMIVDALMCSRSLGIKLAVRRGIPASRVVSTSFPVSGPDGHGRPADQPVDPAERASARSLVLDRFGWPSNTVLVVTAGRAAKFERAPAGLSLLDLVEPVLADAPEARLIAIGPQNTGEWHDAFVRTGGRVAAIGELPQGLGVVHAAGDIYLESRPLGGPGAAAEAAAHGLPVIAHAATPLEREVYVTDAAYGAVCESTFEDYRALLARLISDSALRAQLGDAARTAIAAADEAWDDGVERAYEVARKLGPLAEDELGPLPEPEDVDVLVDSAMPVGRRAPIEQLELVTSQLELASRSPAVRELFGRLDHLSMHLVGRYATAFAAPVPEPAALRAVVAEFRLLRDLGIAHGFLIALEPSAADASIPVLEAAIAAGSDVPVDLVLDPNPAAVRPQGSLEVVVDDDGADIPHRHVCGSALPPPLAAEEIAEHDLVAAASRDDLPVGPS